MVACPACAYYAAHEGSLCPEHEIPMCPACRHDRHRGPCPVRNGWLRRLVGLKRCLCQYWDARWESEPRPEPPQAAGIASRAKARS